MEEIGINQVLLEILNALRNLNNTFNKVHQAPQLTAVPDEWLPENEVMKIFSVSRKTIYNWRQKHALQCRKFGGTVYYLKSEIYKVRDVEL